MKPSLVLKLNRFGSFKVCLLTMFGKCFGRVVIGLNVLGLGNNLFLVFVKKVMFFEMIGKNVVENN